MKTLVWFICGALLFGSATLGIGFAVWPADVFVQGITAFGLAFVPATLTLAWIVYSCRSTPELQLIASLGGSGVRMALALGGGFMLTSAQPATFAMPFWSWLVLFYLSFLGFEMVLIVRQQATLEVPASPAP